MSNIIWQNQMGILCDILILGAGLLQTQYRHAQDFHDTMRTPACKLSFGFSDL